MTTTIDNPDSGIPRDRYGRPLVTPPNGGKQVAYTRCTTFVDCLEDKFNLQRWQQRMVAVGIADRPDLLLSVSAHRSNKQELNGITQQALEAAQAGAAATTGTALHALTETIDRGEGLPTIPDTYHADLDAYRRETSPLHPLLLEQFAVHDELKIGGTADRIVQYQGRGYIADVKTGSSIDFGALKIAMQLAVYARSTPYDYNTGKRSPYPVEVDTSWGIVIHLPAGSGTCQLRWVDLAAGWQAVQIAAQVREWRKHKGWYQDFTTEPGESTTFDPTPVTFADQVAAATTVDELRQIASRANVAGVYGDELHAACLTRKQQLEGAAA